ncbi:MAG: M67 family metallopeptidase [Saprospiraceae bacterium]
MNTYKISIEEAPLNVIYRHGEKAFPYECCGFLYGDEQNGRRITLAVPVANSKEGDQRRRFEISPVEYMKAENYALENNLSLLGVYHSHPNHPAIASQHDLSVAMPYFSYVIVSVMDGKVADIKSWQLKEDKQEFYEERVKIETDTFSPV